MNYMDLAVRRRRFLTLLGGGTVLAAGGAAAWAATRAPRAALEPWHIAGSAHDEPRRRALSWAILAPNPHNRQPWLVDLAEPDTVTLYADPTRRLPETDPFDRQITIGLGCFLELMVLAAAEDGYRVEVEPFPDGFDEGGLDARPVARARFAADPAVRPDPLFAAAPDRRSVKEPYDPDRPVADASLGALAAAAIRGTRTTGSVAPADVAALRTLTREALVVEIDTPRTYRESVELFRIGRREVEASPDGIDFTGPVFELLAAAGQFDREVALDRASAGFRQGRAAVLENADTAMGHVWSVTAGNARPDQIAAGRDWSRIHLAATLEGLAVQPLSQALQEYPEMAGHYREVHARLAPDGGTVQMLARLGHAAPVPPSPRWPLSARLL